MTKKTTRPEQKQPELTDWISPQEASLEMSIKENAYVSPDDIKQLRLTGKLNQESYMHVSSRLTLYLRKAMREFDQFQKRETGEKTFDPKIVATWLEMFPKTIQQLESDGHIIPRKEEAAKLVQERPKKSTKATGGRKPKKIQAQDQDQSPPTKEAA